MAADIFTSFPRTREERWAYLRAGVDLIMSGSQISYSRYQSLYTQAYNYCTSPDTDPTTEKTESTDPQADLYSKLAEYFAADYFEASRKQAEELHDEDLLRYYSSRWSSYDTGANYLNRLFTFLNRHWVKRQRAEGRKDVYPVYTLVLWSWREHFLLSLQQHDRKLTRALIQLAERHREGGTIDTNLINNTLSSLASLGINTENVQSLSLDTYKEHFETVFLETSEERYRKASELLRAENDEYFQAAEVRVQKEKDCISTAGEYLRPETQEELRRRCENVLIGVSAGDLGIEVTQ
ncbi:ubiquitin ligase (cullin) of SCF [Marasmius crinis-equi]|uniref:Ubiquitin ligase (Cullin) of SCF n=1 Tax=Marasmius crinis-equi TaxID=585013 RepID=A0ABR3F2V7_9AGAR